MTYVFEKRALPRKTPPVLFGRILTARAKPTDAIVLFQIVMISLIMRLDL